MKTVTMYGGPDDGFEFKVTDDASCIEIAISNALSLKDYNPMTREPWSDEVAYTRATLPIREQRNGKLIVLWSER